MSDSWMDEAITSDAKEWEVLREVQEVQLELIDTMPATEAKVAEGKVWMRLTFRIIGVDGFLRRIFHYLNYPNSKDDSDGVNTKKLNVNAFYDALGIEGDQRAPRMHEAWRNRMCRAIIYFETNDEYGESNKIQKFVL